MSATYVKSRAREWLMNHHPDKFGIKVLAGGEMDQGPVPGKLCVYAHFDPRGVVANHMH